LTPLVAAVEHLAQALPRGLGPCEGHKFVTFGGPREDA